MRDAGPPRSGPEVRLAQNLIWERPGRSCLSAFCPANLTPGASRWYITRIAQAGIVELTVPAASGSPLAPGDVIAVFAVGIPCFPGRAIDALGVGTCAGDDGSGHRGTCCHDKSHGSAENAKFHIRSFIPLALRELTSTPR